MFPLVNTQFIPSTFPPFFCSCLFFSLFFVVDFLYLVLRFFMCVCVFVSLLLNTLKPSDSFNRTISAFCPYVLNCNIYVLCVILTRSVMVFLHRINRLVLLMGMHAIFCTAATKSLYNHSAFHLTTRTWPLPMRNLYRVRCSASFFNLQYRLSLTSSSSCLRLLPCIPVTFISSFIFPSVLCFRRQFLRKM